MGGRSARPTPTRTLPHQGGGALDLLQRVRASHGNRSPRPSHTILSSCAGSYHITMDPPKYPENSPKLPRTYHVFPPGEAYFYAMHVAGDAADASSREKVQL
jgi:hypothetical protein